MRCLLNKPCHFGFLGVPKNMQSPNSGKIYTKISQKLNIFNMHEPSKFTKFGDKFRDFGQKVTVFANIGQIGETQDMTYSHLNF